MRPPDFVLRREGDWLRRNSTPPVGEGKRPCSQRSASEPSDGCTDGANHQERAPRSKVQWQKVRGSLPSVWWHSKNYPLSIQAFLECLRAAQSWRPAKRETRSKMTKWLSQAATCTTQRSRRRREPQSESTSGGRSRSSLCYSVRRPSPGWLRSRSCSAL